MTFQEDLNEYVSTNADHYNTQLQQLARQPSISVERFGTVECAAVIRKWMQRIGFQKTTLFRESENPTVVGEYRGADSDDRKTLLLFASYDCNPVEDAHWTVPPFEGRIVEKPSLGRCIVARGVNNKAKIAGILCAIESLREMSDELPVNIITVFDGEEEMFSPSLPALVSSFESELKQADSLYMPFAAQSANGLARVQLGYKGIVYVELEASGRASGKGPAEYEIHSMHRPAVQNPIWRLVHALRTMTSDDGDRVLIQGFHDDVVEPDQEFESLLRKLADDFSVDDYKKSLRVATLIEDEDESYSLLRRLFCTSQINIDGISGGYTGVGAEAVIPTDAVAKLDIRLVPHQKSERVLQLLRTHLDTNGYPDIQIHKLAGVESCRSSPDEPIVQALVRAYGKMAVRFQIWPTSLATIPLHVFSSAPLRLPFVTGCVGYGGQSHGPDEYFALDGNERVQGFPGVVKCIASVLHEFGQNGFGTEKKKQ